MKALTDSDWLAIERELCRRSLAEFARRAWHVLEPGTTLVWGWALDAICQHLEALTEGKIDPPRLLINVPPGSMKSLLVSVIWPAWEWGPRGLSHYRVVGTAHEEGLAIRDTRKCRDLIKSAWFQKRWPLPMRRDLDGKTEFGNEYQGVRQARAFTSMTGVRGDRVILDDPISSDNANSAAHLEAARIAFTETLPTRVNSDKSAIVVIMQRLHERDTSGIILSRGLAYEHLCIPMRYEPERHCTTSIGWSDPRTVEGELMFPDRFSEDQVRQLELTLGPYAVAGQLQQRPAPREGALFKAEWLRPVNALPPRETLTVFGASDYAVTANGGDYTVHLVLGLDAQGTMYLLDIWRNQTDSSVWVEAFCDLVLKHKPDQWAEETGQIRSGVGPYIDRRQNERKAFVVREAFPTRGDKSVRAQSIRGRMALNGLHVPINAPWYEAFVSELLTFPAGVNDDQVDALGLAGQLLDRVYMPMAAQEAKKTAMNDYVARQAGSEAGDWMTY